MIKLVFYQSMDIFMISLQTRIIQRKFHHIMVINMIIHHIMITISRQINE